MSKCAQVERQSFHQQNSPMQDKLAIALTRLYAKILAHLGRMVRYYKANSLGMLDMSSHDAFTLPLVMLTPVQQTSWKKVISALDRTRWA